MKIVVYCCKSCALVLFFVLSPLLGSELDFVIAPQRSFHSAATKSLGDAGVAYPLDISSGLINPALVFSNHRKFSSTRGALTFGYGRDSVYNKNIIPLGVSYSSTDGSIAGFYRLLTNDNKQIQNEITLNMSGQLYSAYEEEYGVPQNGPVDFGVNIRYEYFSWKERIIGPFSNYFTHLDSNQTNAGSDTITDSLISVKGRINQKRLLLDIGMYQSDVAPNLDFGITLRNALGYIWSNEYPIVGDSVTGTRITDNDSLEEHRRYYKNESLKKKAWLNKKYKVLTAGLVYHIIFPNNVYRISLPMDFEIIGMFDKKVKNRYIFRGGIAAELGGHFSLMVGYSRAPGPIKSTWEEFRNVNVFTGGGGITFNPVTFNFYIADRAFGSTIIITY